MKRVWIILGLCVIVLRVHQSRADYLLWTDSSNFGSGENTGGDIRRANIDGSGPTTLVRGLVGPYGIAVDSADGMMYWTNGNADTDTGDIRRSDLYGTSSQVLVRPVLPVAVAVDGAAGKMYWIQHFQHAQPKGLDIHRANLDGSGNETLLHVAVQGNGSLALDAAGGKMYWTDLNDGLIRTANLDGSNPTTLVSGQNNPLGISLDLARGKMYWTDFHGSTNGQGGDIRRANLDGTGQETVLSGLNGGPGGLTLDLAHGKMYWTDYFGNDIRQANLDGSGQTTLVRGLNNPGGICLVPSPPGDANGDRRVDFADLLILAQNYGLSKGGTYALGDFNSDGSVSFDDLLILAQHYGTAGAPSLASVPEPSCVAIIGFGCAGLVRRRLR